VTCSAVTVCKSHRYRLREHTLTRLTFAVCNSHRYGLGQYKHTIDIRDPNGFAEVRLIATMQWIMTVVVRGLIYTVCARRLLDTARTINHPALYVTTTVLFDIARSVHHPCVVRIHTSRSFYV
jgi:hypothetical protein